MSISLPLAVTMMIGTDDRRRISRHTSMPETFGSITSSSTRSGRTASNTSSASAPSRGHLHAEALPLQPDGEGLDEGVLVLDHQDGGIGGAHGPINLPLR